MMPWLRAVFTSVVSDEFKARGQLKVRTWPIAIAIGAKSLPAVFAAANLHVGKEEAATCVDRGHTLPPPGPLTRPRTLTADHCIPQSFLSNVCTLRLPPTNRPSGPPFWTTLPGLRRSRLG